MTFFDNNKSNKSATEQEIDCLIKARGFEPGRYKFIPNPNTQRSEGSIINGVVKGKFTMYDKDIDFIIFDRDDFSEKSWKRICSSMGFKYHNHIDIDRFIILPNTVDVEVSIITPMEEI